MAFCKNCGKELKKGEKCNCAEVKETKKEETKSSNSGFDFAKTMVAIKDDLVKYFKKPVDVLNDNTKEEDMPKTYIMALLYSLTFGFFFCGVYRLSLFMSATDKSSKKLLKTFLDKVDIPWFKIGIYGFAIAAVMLLAYAVAILVIPAIFKNKKIDFKKALTLTSAAMLPLSVVNVVCAILALLDVDYRVVLVIYVFASLIVNYNYVYVYAKMTDVEDNKFGIIIATLVGIAMAISVLNIYLTNEKFTESVQESVTKSSIDIDDDF